MSGELTFDDFGKNMMNERSEDGSSDQGSIDSASLLESIKT